MQALQGLFPFRLGTFPATRGRRSRDPRARVAGKVREKNGNFRCGNVKIAVFYLEFIGRFYKLACDEFSAIVP